MSDTWPIRLSRAAGYGLGQLSLNNFRLDLIAFYLLVFLTVAFSQDASHFQLLINQDFSLGGLSAKALTEEPTSVSHFQIKGISFHVIEIFLAIIVLAIVLRRFRERDFSFERTPLDLWFGLWLAYGSFELVRGIILFGDYSVAFHDFGLVYYIAFFYIAREVCSDWQKIKGLFFVFSVAAGARILKASWNYVFNLNYSEVEGIDWTQYDKFMPNIAGVNILLTLVVGIALWGFTQKSRWAVFLYLSFATFALTLTQQRSLLIALLIAFGVLTAGAKLWGLSKPLSLHWLVIGAVFVGSVLWGIRAEIAPFKPGAFLSPIHSLAAKASGVGDKIAADVGEGTARFRQDAWQEAWRRILDSPILGEGLGQKFRFYDSKQEKWWTSQPHNAHITILYKMGAVGLLCFLGIHFVLFKKLYEAVTQDCHKRAKTYVLGLGAGIIALQAYGFLNILFERRSLALVYWSLMGVLATVISLPKSQLEAG